MKRWIPLWLMFWACSGASGPDLIIGPNGATSLNPAPSFAAVIGEEVKIYAASGESFHPPVSISIEDSTAHLVSVAPQFTENQMTIRIPAAIASGVAKLFVTTSTQPVQSGSLQIRRLGVVANRGSGELLLFDTDDPTSTERFSLASQAGFPEDVTLSPDGRYAHVVLAGSPAAVTVDITKKPPEIVSNFLPTEHFASSLGIFDAAFLALVPNYGDSRAPGDTLDIFRLQSHGILETKLAALDLGTRASSRPYGLGLAPSGFAFALVTNRGDASLSRVDLSACVDFPDAGCAALETFSSPTWQEPAGVAIDPSAAFALVSDFAQNRVDQIDLQTSTMELSGSLPLDGGDQGPVAIRITPGGGRALVLNEGSATLTLLDLSQGFPSVFFSLPLGGSLPEKIALSHQGTLAWISFSGSHEVRRVALNLYSPLVSAPLPIPELDNPRGLAIQP